MKKLGLIFTAAFGLMCSAAMAQKDTVSQNFIKMANIGGTKEVKAGKLATTKGKSASVKAFGAKMITDHTMANNKLKALALKKGYVVFPPPASETAPDAMLTGASGAAFDKNYVSMMVMDHKKTIALFEHEASMGTDPDIKAFANQTLPKLRDHLARIQQIAKSMNLPTE